ncbi:MAG: adenosylcobinamide-GDP ribazoletransferase [Magnetococcales bacterium]|nr:adenosylcobinamide-GDP ribazoletransferase [Magnetococcales bacterium]
MRVRVIAASRALRLALGLLTRLPVGVITPPVTEAELGRSVLFYPLVGLLIGLILIGVEWATRTAGEALRPFLLLVVWVILTGGLHLDGLADAADAAVGGMGSRQRTLEIMKDPRSGPMAVTTVALLLVGKYAALFDLLRSGDFAHLLLTIPLLARLLFVALFLTTPYASPRGMAAAAVAHLPRSQAIGVVLAMTMGVIWVNPLPAALLLLLVAGLTFLTLRRIFMRRVQGFTGDLAGALCEVNELLLLISAAWQTTALFAAT